MHLVKLLVGRARPELCAEHGAYSLTSRVTGEAFLKMIPLLASMGIVTLRQALDAAQKTYFARIKY